MLSAKLAPPIAVDRALSCLLLPLAVYKALSDSASPRHQIAPLIIIAAPPGYLITECLAEVLSETGRSRIWLRLEPGDSDPATFLLALIHAAQQAQPGLGAHTLQKMRSQPGPIYGWPALFASLGEEISQNISSPAVIVIERFHHLYDHEQIAVLFRSHFLPALTSQITIILISHQTVAKTDLPAHARLIETNELRLEESAGLALAKEYAPELSREVVSRALRISNQRPGILAGLFAANTTLGPARVAKVVIRAGNASQLLASLGRDCLAAENAISPQILALALQVEYLCQDLILTIWGEPILPGGPWMQPLANEWVRLRSLWHSTLQDIIHTPNATHQHFLQQTADYWLQSGQPHAAIPLYLQVNDFPHSAAALASVREEMLNLGQWERLAQWIGQLPEDILSEWPWLVYSLGEIDAAGSRLVTARRWFALAANWFARQNEPGGVCHSLLAESTLAAWHNDLEHAQTSAHLAYQVAHKAGLTRMQGWASWQLGRIASTSNHFLEASSFFEQSAMALSATHFAPLAAEAHSLAERQWQLLQQYDQHQQALLEIEAAQRLTTSHLEQMLTAPQATLASDLVELGWVQVPLMMKLSPGPSPTEAASTHWPGKIWSLIRQAWCARAWGPIRRLMRRLANYPPVEAAPVKRVIDRQLPKLAAELLAEPLVGTREADLGLATTNQEPSSANGEQTPTIETHAVELPPTHSATPLPEPDLIVKAGAETAPLSGLSVYCLGPFRVFYHNQFIDNFGSKKAQQLFKYLVTHRQYPTPKDVLMDTFWPEADPEAARRNLHQAVYVLRQAFKTELDLHCICFENDSYYVSPEQGLWIDHEVFEQHARAGQQLEHNRQVEQAMGEYGIAEGLYQDDFLVEDLYEDWPKSRREFLWQLYLLITQRLAEYYLERKEYAAAMSLSRRILARDPAQEPAHQVLIRAYLGQGLRHMALRQYKSCAQILKQELSLPPSPPTQALYQQILKAE